MSTFAPDKPFSGDYPTPEELERFDAMATWVRHRAWVVLNALYDGAFLQYVDEDRAIVFYADSEDEEDHVLSQLPEHTPWFLCPEEDVPQVAQAWLKAEQDRRAAEEAARAQARKEAQERAAVENARKERYALYQELRREFGSALDD